MSDVSMSVAMCFIFYSIKLHMLERIFILFFLIIIIDDGND